MGSASPDTRLWSNLHDKGQDVTAAIHFEAEAYDVAHRKPMGRHFAGHGFLSAFARFSSVDDSGLYVRIA
jgi:hypothetical protein